MALLFMHVSLRNSWDKNKNNNMMKTRPLAILVMVFSIPTLLISLTFAFIGIMYWFDIGDYNTPLIKMLSGKGGNKALAIMGLISIIGTSLIFSYGLLGFRNAKKIDKLDSLIDDNLRKQRRLNELRDQYLALIEVRNSERNSI